MSYYQVLGLVREPFSTSPDPELLYRSKNHLECLQHMEIAVRLRRGLNVVLGEVGTGKTTLGRELQRLLVLDPDIEVHVLDDPYFPEAVAFLAALARLIGLDTAGLEEDQARLKEAIKSELLRRGGDGRRIVTLIVDEGQKITGECLELLRELLNFETASHKLLQIVIFAQQEFDAVLTARPNLDDRVNFRYELRPLGRQQTRRMIEARLNLCAPDGRGPQLFTDLAYRRIYRLTGGYPRKIVRLCHMAMLQAVGLGRHRVGWGLVGRAAREMRGPGLGVWMRRLALAGAFAGLVGTLAVTSQGIESMRQRQRQTAVASLATPTEQSMPATDGLPGASGAEANEPLATATTTTEAAPATTWHEVRGQVTLPSVREPAEAAAEQQRSSPELVASHGRGEDQAETDGFPAAPEVALAEEVVLVAEADQPSSQAPTGATKTVGTPVAAETDRAEATAEASSASLAVLGEATTRVGWTVSRQALWVYGNSGRAILRQLAKANPNIDCEKIRAGQTLTFPAIAASPPPRGTRILSLGNVESLEKGLAHIGSLTESPLPLTLFVTHEPGKGLCVQVVAYALYGDPTSAAAALASLPPALAAKARVVEHFPQGTTFYTDLSLANGKRAQPKSFTPVPFRRQVAATETR